MNPIVYMLAITAFLGLSWLVRIVVSDKFVNKVHKKERENKESDG